MTSESQPTPTRPSSWSERMATWSPRAVALSVLLLLVCASGIWLMEGEAQRHDVLRVQARQVADSQAYTLQRTLEQNLTALEVMAARIEQGGGDVSDFERVAGELLASRPDIRAIGLLPQGVVTKVMPAALGAGVIGMDVLRGPRAHAGAQLAVSSRGMVVSAPVQVPMGEVAFAVHLPVYVTGHAAVKAADEGPRRFWGLVRAAVSLSAFLSSARLDRLVEQGFDYQLWAPDTGDAASGQVQPEQSPGRKLVASSLSEGQVISAPLLGDVGMPGRPWILGVAPRNGWMHPTSLALRTLWAALFSVCGAGLVYLLLERLRQTRGMLKNLADHVPGALYQYRISRDGVAQFTFVSQGMAAICGLEEGDLRDTDQQWRKLLHPDDRRTMREGIQQSAQDLLPFESDFRITHPVDGHVRWLWTRAQPHREPDGSVVWNGYIADWSSEKGTEDALKQSNQLLLEAQEVARLGYFITDVSTGKWTSSVLLDNIFGIGPTFDRSAEGWASLVEPEFREGLRDAYQRAVADRAGFSVEYRIRRPKDDRVVWVQALGRLEFDGKGQVLRIVGTVQDITQRKKAEADIINLAYYDPLTGLPNRRLLFDRLNQALVDRCADHGHGALMFIDLDNFKDLNDTLGHDKGDALLQMVALRLLSSVRESDTVSRLGGDEFVLLLPKLELHAGDDPVEVAESVGLKVIAALARPYTLAGSSHTSTPSMGVTLFADEGLVVEEVIKRADVAMYQAKAGGRNTLRFYDPAIQAEFAQRLQLAEDLRLALSSNQLTLQYQPQHNHLGRLIGAEALLRWNHPTRGPVSPGVFIPLAEQVGLIGLLGQWVLSTAAHQLKAWLADDRLSALKTGFTLAVNVSAHQFRSRDFVDDVLRVLRQAELAPGVLKLELTESLMVHDVEDIISKMNALRPAGVLFSLDDFGTGYSSLTYLKRLPLDQLKIDQSFVRDVMHNSNDAGIARTVVALGQTLGLEVIAEGVETESQRLFLLDIGCECYQGYLFSKPLVSSDFKIYALDSIQ